MSQVTQHAGEFLAWLDGAIVTNKATGEHWLPEGLDSQFWHLADSLVRATGKPGRHNDQSDLLDAVIVIANTLKRDISGEKVRRRVLTADGWRFEEDWPRPRLTTKRLITVRQQLAVLSGAEAEKADPSPAPVSPMPATAEQLMAAMITKDPSRLAWSAQNWADAIGKSKTAVLATETWKKTIMSARALSAVKNATKPR